jgi:hypothetical protein
VRTRKLKLPSQQQRAQALYADRAGLRHLALRMLVTGAALLAVAQLSLELITPGCVI